MSRYETDSSRIQGKQDKIEIRRNKREMSHIYLCSREQKVYRLYLILHACSCGKGRNEITRDTDSVAGDKEYGYINPE